MTTRTFLVVLVSLGGCSQPSTDGNRVDKTAALPPSDPDLATMISFDQLSCTDDGGHLHVTFRLSNNSSRSIYFKSLDDYLPDASPRGDWELLSEDGWRKADPWFFENGNQIMLVDMGRVCACELPPRQNLEFSRVLDKTRIGNALKIRFCITVASDDSDGFEHGQDVHSPSMPGEGR
jgi:hypothetical protein